jgi:SOS response regulatory protein OraA/RecX
MEFVETTITEHIYNQGEAEGRKKTAINLLKMGIDMEIITQASNFSEAEIKQLIKPSEVITAES